MSPAEVRAFRSAVALLLLLSLGRWAQARRTVDALPPAPDVASAHASAAQEAVERQDQRSRPLGEGERVDPNRASEGELDRLPGVGPSRARAIVEARERGVVFRAPSDMEVIRGVGPAMVERMAPYLAFPSPPPARRRRPDSSPSPSADRRFGALPVDVNRAGVDELVTLPGIGPVMAARIVEARKAGPFGSLEELTRVQGIGPATVGRLRGLASARSGHR